MLAVAQTELIATIAISLCAALALGVVARKLRLAPIVGYMLAGIAVGPHTPGFVADAHLAEQLAEIGIALLMFGVGLHFSVDDLVSVRRVAIPGAVGQSLVATVFGVALALLCGWTLSAGIVFGLALSVASTVVLVRGLTDLRQLHSLHGHVAVGWLVVEDLFTVLILVALPALAGASDGSLAADLGSTALKIAVLALDGGGIHGLFTLEVLAELEARLRDTHGGGRADWRLCDYFDLIAGTSTGGIIATMLAWGFPVADVIALYLASSRQIFVKAHWYERFKFKFSGDPLGATLRAMFSEDDGTPATLGSDKLRTLLLVTMKNGSTGSAWPICNNPHGRYNDRSTRGAASNLDIPLWQLVRASTAAPTFFPAQAITVMGRPQEFLDGGTTPYNNPALIAACFALLPEYCIRFAPGEDRLLLVSVGTGRRDVRYGKGEIHDMSIPSHAIAVIRSLMDEVSVEQDTVCRVLGRCRFGAPIDREIGDLTAPDASRPRRFSYVRYNHTYTAAEVDAACSQYRCTWALDALPLIPVIRATGARYAKDQVRLDHFAGFLDG